MKRLLLVTCLALLFMSESPAQFLMPDRVADTDNDVDGSEFVFARLAYGSGMAGYGRRGQSWRTDWPAADEKFMFGIDRLSNIRIVLDDYISVRIMDPALFSYPFVYAVEVGHMELTQPEADQLREYMLRGGTLVVDDFWGTREWESFARNVRKIFPDKEVEQIPMSHPIFHTFYDIDHIMQIPNIRNGQSGYQTHERDGYVPYCLGIFDDDRRPMMVVNYNTDLGDAWEWADDPYYPNEFSGMAYRMGINFIIYSMTH